MTSFTPSPSLTFVLSPSSRFSPRVGCLTLRRAGSHALKIETPGIITVTSRGTVPHLSRDHYRATDAIRWAHIPFETFLEHKPPVPTLQKGPSPLHTFLGFDPHRHIVSVSARDPSDGREMPTNGKDFVSVQSLRGVRKISPAEWRSYTSAIQPDFALALSDTPFTNPPYSQKRLTKSVERSHAWLANFIRPSPYDTLAVHTLVHMAGGTSIPARRAFANGLVETLFGAEADSVQPLKCLDEGVTGYVFDSVPLHIAIAAASQRDNDKPVDAVELVPLIQSSLTSLPLEKPRIVMSSSSPQEMLTLILSCGIDLFDAQWAQRAADIGVALDFTFPISKKGPPLAENGKRSLGHNLYDTSYAQDFSRLAETFAGEANRGEEDLVCPCIACSPCSISTPIPHSSIDSFAPPLAFNPSTSRAYVHHLLHTHEMSAHALLAAHNVNVLDAMFAGVRKVAQASKEDFEKEVQLFLEHYDGSLWVFKEAASSWKEVDLARGKGRLAREKLREVGDAQI